MYAVESIVHAEEYIDKPEPSSGTGEIMAFFSALVRSETRLYNALHETLRARHGLTTSQFEFLLYLSGHPHARVAELARTFAIGIGATSKGIDRLQRSGWVQRVDNPDDRRSSFLELTTSGRTLITAAESTFQTRLFEILGDAGALEELPTATPLLRKVQGFLEKQDLGTPSG